MMLTMLRLSSNRSDNPLVALKTKFGKVVFLFKIAFMATVVDMFSFIGNVDPVRSRTFN